MSDFLFDRNRVITPHITITPDCISEIKQELHVSERVIVDMKDVTEISNSVLKFMCDYNKRIILVNTNSTVLFLIYASEVDRQLKIFEDEISLLEDKNELINRQFYAV